jgi:hypothetical protein
MAVRVMKLIRPGSFLLSVHAAIEPRRNAGLLQTGRPLVEGRAKGL